MMVQMPPSLEQPSFLVKVIFSLNTTNLLHTSTTQPSYPLKIHTFPLTAHPITLNSPYLPTSLPPLLLVMSLERRNVSSQEPETQMCDIPFDIMRHKKINLRVSSSMRNFLYRLYLIL